MILSRGTRPASVPQTILFVDDEPSLLEARRLVFEAMGYRALTADSGERALELLQTNTVNAVILDYVLPGMDGEEIARRIRKGYADIVIILSSGGVTAPQRLMEVVSASVSKGKGAVALLEVLEQQLEIVQGRGTQETAAYPGSLVSS